MIKGTHVVDRLFDLFPVRSALDEFVQIFRSICPSISGHISDDLCQVFCVGDNVDLTEHLEIRKLFRHTRLLQGGNKGVVSVKIRYHLETAVERDDLSLDVLLQDADTREVTGQQRLLLLRFSR